MTPAHPDTGLVKVTPNDPKFGEPGSAVVRVDSVGRLRSIYRVRPANASSPASGPIPWADLFRLAGLDLSAFTYAEPTWDWRVPHDTRLAWQGVFPERPSIPLRVEAATDRGEVVGLVLVAPWSSPTDDFQATEPPALVTRVINFIGAVLLPALMLGAGGWLAYRNTRRGTANIRGAIRLTLAYATARSVAQLLALWNELGAGVSWSLFTTLTAHAVFDALRLGVAYMAIEPYARRRWAPQLITWQRLIAGRWVDPRVGRDVLLGLAAAGVLWSTTFAGYLVNQINGMETLPIPASAGFYQSTGLVRWLLESGTRMLDGVMMLSFLVFLLAAVTRKVWIWLPILLAVFWTMVLAANLYPGKVVYTACMMVGGGAVITFCVRYGLLVSFMTLLGTEVMVHMSVEGWGTWFWQAAFWPWVVLLTLTLYGLVVSVGGWRRLVRADTAG